MTHLQRLEKLAKSIGENLVLRYPDIDGNWMARIDGAEVRNGCILSSPCGHGNCPDYAAGYYLREISGQTIVLHAMSKDLRREIFILPCDAAPEKP